MTRIYHQKQQIIMLLLCITFSVSYGQGETQNPSSAFWRTNGNSGVSASQFIGTVNNASLRFAVNNNLRMILDSTGNVGIGTTAPSEKLEVAGNFKLSQAFMPGGTAGTSGQFLLSGGSNAAPTWSPFTIGNPNATTVIAKYYSLLSWNGNWSNGSTKVFTINDPDCTSSSAISVSFTGADATLNGITINNVQTDSGYFVVSCTNNTGSSLMGSVAIGFIAFY